MNLNKGLVRSDKLRVEFLNIFDLIFFPPSTPWRSRTISFQHFSLAIVAIVSAAVFSLEENPFTFYASHSKIILSGNSYFYIGYLLGALLCFFLSFPFCWVLTFILNSGKVWIRKLFTSDRPSKYKLLRRVGRCWQDRPRTLDADQTVWPEDN